MDVPISEVAKKHAVSEGTIYAWRKCLQPVDVKRLRVLEQENGKVDNSACRHDLHDSIIGCPDTTLPVGSI